jgi:hypothetical protein
MYIEGMLEFYETGETHTISKAFLESYRKSVQRYRDALTQVLGSEADALSNKILQILINTTIKSNKRITQPQQVIEEYLQRNHHHLAVEVRTEIIQNVIQTIDNLNETTAIGVGIPLQQYQKYRAITNF